MERIATEVLTALYTSTLESRAVLDYLSRRERSYRETKPETLMLNVRQSENVEVTRAEMIRIFRELERANCGKYVEGRRGYSSRFEWVVKMSDVGRIASGDVSFVPQEVESLSPTEIDEEAVDSGSFITHEFYIRPGFQMRLTLPSDLSKSEANRISEWIRTLPFE